MRPRLLAAGLAAAIIGAVASLSLWLSWPQPAPPDLEREYWAGIAKVEEIDAQAKAAEKRCHGPIDTDSDGQVRCLRR